MPGAILGNVSFSVAVCSAGCLPGGQAIRARLWAILSAETQDNSSGQRGVEVQFAAFPKLQNAVAVIGLEMEPNERALMNLLDTKFFQIRHADPADQAGSPSRTTATPIPGTLFADMKLEQPFRLPSASQQRCSFCCAEAAEAQATSKARR